MASYSELPVQEITVPIPAAYTRQLSYGISQDSLFNHHGFTETKSVTSKSSFTEADGLREKGPDDDSEDETSTAKRRSSLLLYLRDSRIYLRILTVFIMIVSLSLILSAVVMYSNAQNKPGHPLDTIPQPPTGVTDKPCLVFSGIVVVNLFLSLTFLFFSCMSSKFRKSNNALNAVFTILSAIGFSTSMAACFHLNAQTQLQNDLWKWACNNHNNKISSDALDFGAVCHVVNYGWKFGLVQASLELLTFIISCTAFIILKYSYFTRYGRFGKIF